MPSLEGQITKLSEAVIEMKSLMQRMVAARIPPKPMSLQEKRSPANARQHASMEKILENVSVLQLKGQSDKMCSFWRWTVFPQFKWEKVSCQGKFNPNTLLIQQV